MKAGAYDFIEKPFGVTELENTIEVYRHFPKEELLTFYGVNERFGLIYEWVDNLIYLRKMRDATVHNILLHDADQIEVGGKIKYIDFWSSPAKNKMHKENQGRYQNINNLLSKGERCFNAGDVENAKTCFEAILDLDPQNVAELERC